MLERLGQEERGLPQDAVEREAGLVLLLSGIGTNACRRLGSNVSVGIRQDNHGPALDRPAGQYLLSPGPPILACPGPTLGRGRVQDHNVNDHAP
eukprot:4383561-Lingulodinium_polyedra.AAC.1